MTAGSLLAAALVAGALNWAAVARRSIGGEYLLKPLTLGLLIAAAVSLGGIAPAHQWRFTVAALVLCLAGDVLLMLPRDRLAAGLGAFLAAHLCYAAAFTPSLPPPAAGPIALLPALAGTVFFVRIRGHLPARLRAPVAAYVAAISLMAAAAATMLVRPEVPPGPAAAGAAGALLFFASDGLVAWRRFVAARPWMQPFARALYHLGQTGLVLALLR